MVFAQCSYDQSCTISPAFPTICPIQLPDATVGESYTTDLELPVSPVELHTTGVPKVIVVPLTVPTTAVP